MTLTSEPGLAGGRLPGPYLAASPYPASAYPSSPDPGDGTYPENGGPPAAPPAPAVVIQTCWMCGIRLPTTLMVPDGGAGCPDIRWYCQDARQCTARWTQQRRP